MYKLLSYYYLYICKYWTLYNKPYINENNLISAPNTSYNIQIYPAIHEITASKTC